MFLLAFFDLFEVFRRQFRDFFTRFQQNDPVNVEGESLPRIFAETVKQADVSRIDLFFPELLPDWYYQLGACLRPEFF